MNYAVNRLFFQGDAGRSLGEDADLFEQHRTGDPALDELLRRCYDEVACRFEIEPTVTIFTPTQIASGSTTHGLPAQVVNDLDFAGRDIAALQMIDADPLATVPLATSTADLETGDVVIALGYPGSVQELPSLLEPMKLVGHITNVTSDGTSQVIQVDMNVESGMSGGPGLDERGRVIGLLSSGGYQVAGHHQACLLPVEDIRSVLHRAKVEAARGEIDQVFEQAMDCFWNRHYGAAVPLYRQVLGLQPGHPLAEWYLAQAETRAGGIEDVPLPGTTAGNALVVRLVRLLGLAAGVVMVMAVIRRYRSIRKG
jgi:Trypsin-like peptidase domain